MIKADIADAVLLDDGIGPRQRESDDVLFQREVIAWIKEWMLDRDDTSEHKDPCVFLFHPSKPSNAVLRNGVLRQCFRISKPNDLAGFAYACAIGMKSVYRLALPAKTCELSDVLDWMKKEEIGDCVAVILLPDRRRAFVKPIDIPIAEIDEIAVVDFPKKADIQEFDFSQLDTLLETFYNYGVATHGGHCRIWNDQKKRTLCRDPEDMVQRALSLFLLARIELRGAGLVRTEIQNVRGREDIEITRHSSSGYEIGILELKVLKPNKSQQWNLDWALKGIQQAVDYANSREYVAAKYTLCYDGRKQDAAIPEFFSKATKENVFGRRYFMATPTVSRTILSFIQ